MYNALQRSKVYSTALSLVPFDYSYLKVKPILTGFFKHHISDVGVKSIN